MRNFELTSVFSQHVLRRSRISGFRGPDLFLRRHQWSDQVWDQVESAAGTEFGDHLPHKFSALTKQILNWTEIGNVLNIEVNISEIDWFLICNCVTLADVLSGVNLVYSIFMKVNFFLFDWPFYQNLYCN